MRLLIAFCEGGYGNRYFQISYLLKNFKERKFIVFQSLQIDGAKNFRIKFIENICFITLHPRVYLVARKLTVAVAQYFQLGLGFEDIDEISGPIGVLKISNENENVIIVRDFYMVVANRENTVDSHKKILLFNANFRVPENNFDIFLHVRIGDYIKFNHRGNYLDFRYYYRYYLRSIRKISLQHSFVKCIGVYTDEPQNRIIYRLIAYAASKGIAASNASSGNAKIDWISMSRTKYGGICSASTFSLSALLSANYKIGYIPRGWLNFNRNSCFPASMIDSKYTVDGNIWII